LEIGVGSTTGGRCLVTRDCVHANTAAEANAGREV
jgi:hypothetical protein